MCMSKPHDENSTSSFPVLKVLLWLFVFEFIFIYYILYNRNPSDQDVDIYFKKMMDVAHRDFPFIKLMDCSKPSTIFVV